MMSEQTHYYKNTPANISTVTHMNSSYSRK